jgi:hypothetical protein
MIGETHGGRLGSWLARPMGQVGFKIGETHGGRLGSWLARPMGQVGFKIGETHGRLVPWLVRYMLGFIYDYREICWFKPVVGLSVRPSTFPSAFLLVSQVDYIPTYLSLLLSACLSYFYVHIVFHSTVSLSLRLSVRPSTFPSAFPLFSQSAFYDHLPFPLPFCLFRRLPVYMSTLPFPCLLFLRLPIVHLSFHVCLLLVEGEGVDCSLYVYFVWSFTGVIEERTWIRNNA